MKLFDLLGGPIRDLLGVVKDTIDEVSTTGEEKLAAQLALASAEQDFLLKLAEAEASIVAEQASVIKSEAASHSWLARNWRPILMIVFTYIIAHTYVLVPIFSLPVVEIPPDMWELLKLGVGGYVVGRTVEKVVPQFASKTSNK